MAPAQQGKLVLFLLLAGGTPSLAAPAYHTTTAAGAKYDSCFTGRFRAADYNSDAATAECSGFETCPPGSYCRGGAKISCPP